MKKMTLAALAVMTCAAAWAGEDEDKARGILEAQQKAVVTVQLVVKEKMSGMGFGAQDNESKVEITGTTIDADGLTVVALSDTDRMAMMSNFMPDDMEGHFKVESSISDVKILQEDGSEIESGVVLRDKDLDLAFVRPKQKPATAMPFVDLKANAPTRLLDRVVTINRLGKVANRAASASLEYIEAVVAKPRTFYFPGRALTMTGTGCPAFALDGKIIGVFVTRSIADKSGDFDPARSAAVVILPATDIAEGASQAPPFGQEPKEPAPAPAEESKPDAKPADTIIPIK